MNKYYHILGIEPGAEKDEIKAAYRKLAKQYHPDINKTTEANFRFIEVKEAYEYLMSHNYEPDPQPHPYFAEDFNFGGTTYYYRSGTVSAVDPFTDSFIYIDINF